MTDKSIPPDADDQDSWENLAKDLFGVEFDSPPVSSDDLDDELLNDDFLKDDDDGDASDEGETSAESQTEDEPEIVSFAAADEPEPEDSRPVHASHEVDLDVLLDFSQPLDDDDDEAESVVSTRSEEPKSGSGASFFERLAAESEEVDEREEVEPVTFAERDVEIVDEFDEDDDEESDDESEELEFEDDEQLETDDFWDALEKFSPEELGTPHVDRGQTRGGKPPRDPEIGLVSGSAANEIRESATFETEFEADADFGLGILEDVETDEEDDAEEIESVSRGRRTDGEDDQEEKKPRRRRRRRRRGGRRKKPVSETEEGASADEDAEDAPRRERVQSRAVSQEIEDIDDEDLSEDLSQDETGDNEDDDESSRASGGSRYKNIPTWSEAIDLIADRKAKSSSESRGRRGTSSSETKNRKRGGRRRRPRKPSS